MQLTLGTNSAIFLIFVDFSEFPSDFGKYTDRIYQCQQQNEISFVICYVKMP